MYPKYIASFPDSAATECKHCNQCWCSEVEEPGKEATKYIFQTQPVIIFFKCIVKLGWESSWISSQQRVVGIMCPSCANHCWLVTSWKWKCLRRNVTRCTLLAKHLLSIDFENIIRTIYQNWRNTIWSWLLKEVSPGSMPSRSHLAARKHIRTC